MIFKEIGNGKDVAVISHYLLKKVIDIYEKEIVEFSSKSAECRIKY